MTKLIILDRDGVINEDSDDFIKSPDEWHPIPGSLEAIARLNQAGYRVVVASNQSGLGRGLFTVETLNRIHEKMHRRVANHGGVIDAIFYCPHKPADNCECRKPAAGLFRDICQRLKCSLYNVPAIGDSLRDIQAARSAGASPILVRTGKGQRTLDQSAHDELESVPVFDNLAAVVDYLLEEQQ